MIGVFVLLFLIPVGFGYAIGINGREKQAAALLGSTAGAIALGSVIILSHVDMAHGIHLKAMLAGAVIFGLVGAVPGLLGGLGAYSHRAMMRLSAAQCVRFSVYIGALSLILLVLTVPAMYSRREKPSPRVSCASNLRQIGLALAMYADKYGDKIPPESGANGLDHLREIIAAPKIFHCPKDQMRREPRPGEALTEDTVSYVYAGGVWQGTNEAPVCWDKPGNHNRDGLNVLFNDGHVEFMKLDRWAALQKKN